MSLSHYLLKSEREKMHYKCLAVLTSTNVQQLQNKPPTNITRRLPQVCTQAIRGFSEMWVYQWVYCLSPNSELSCFLVYLCCSEIVSEENLDLSASYGRNTSIKKYHPFALVVALACWRHTSRGSLIPILLDLSVICLPKQFLAYAV